MFLRKLRIRNLRSIGDIEISFEDELGSARLWTMLLGQNGVGKSTVLKAIAMVTAGGEALAELVKDPDQWIRTGVRTASIEIEYATASNDRRRAMLSFRRGSGIRQFLALNSKSLIQLDKALGHANRNYFVVGYGVSRRRSPSDALFARSNPFRNARAQNVATMFSSDAALMSIEQWAMDLDYRKGRSGLSVVRKSLDAMMPGVRFEGIDKKERQLLFRTAEGRLPLAQLSDGYQSMAAWCGDILFRMSEVFQDYADPLKVRGVLLLDEIDLHLHPLWQRQLVYFLNRTLPRFQIIATTHSPITAHQTGQGELFILERPRETAAAAVRRYEGAANQLSLDQVIRSPLFGIHTLDSVKVNELRNETRRRKKLPTIEPEDTASHFVAADVDGSLSDVSAGELNERVERIAERASVPDYLKPTNELLASLRTELSRLPVSKKKAVKKAQPRKKVQSKR